MPSFHIHWKGCPHHRLPRIRVASTPRTSIHTRSQLAAEQAFRKPLGGALENARKKHRLNIRFGRRRRRISRSTSSVARCQRRASQRARHNIQVFGWGTSQAELASNRTFTPTLRTVSARTINRSGSGSVRQSPLQDSVIPSTDGAASSSVRQTKPYTKGGKENRRKLSTPDRSRTPSARRIRAETSRRGPLEKVDRNNAFRGSYTLGRSRTYDPRIDPKARKEQCRSNFGPDRVKATSPRTEELSRASVKTKQQSRAPSELLEAVTSLVQQTRSQRSSSIATPSIQTIVPSVLSGISSRSPSQRKALRKFTREIELYLQATRSLPRGTLEATPSVTTISARTIDEFKPYQQQFQSAGLAVTSAEQLRLVKSRKEASPPPTPPKDVSYSKGESLVDETPPPTPPKDHKWSNRDSLPNDNMGPRKGKQTEEQRQPTYDSVSTATTLMQFTPLYEKSAPVSRQRTERQPPSESDHTVIGFTPPHEMSAPPPARPPPSVPSPTRKSLPWLRKPDSGAVSPSKKASARPAKEKPRPSTPLEGWVDQESPKKKGKTPEKPQKSIPEVPLRPISKRSTVQWKEPRYSDEETPDDFSRPIIPPTDEEQLTPSLAAIIQEARKATTAAAAFSSSTAPVRGPFQASAAMRSRNKRVAEEQSKDQDQNDSEVKSPIRQAPPSVPCTNCARERRSDAPEPDPQPEPQSELDYEPTSRPAQCHTCTSRSSLICGQCSPSPQASAVNSPILPSPWERPSRRSTRDIIPTGPFYEPKEHVETPKDEPAVVCPCPKEMFVPVQVVKEVLLDYTDPPIPDPCKQPPAPRLKLKATRVSQPPPQHKQYSTSSRPKVHSYAPQPPTLVYVPSQLPVFTSNSSLSPALPKPGHITDKQVFKGLHVATAAACDEDVDKWIEEITGCGVRKFLADLSRFEGLGVNTLADVAKRAARQRRERLRAWEIVREVRVKQRGDAKEQCSARKETSEGCVEKQDDEDIDWVVDEMGVVARDEESECRVIHTKDCRSSVDVDGGR